jgi:hypothetical protein
MHVVLDHSCPPRCSHTHPSISLQVANDSLSLRQPVHNTCLTFLSTPQQLLAGTQRGDVRRYDTRTARKPVAEWKQIAKGNGIGGVEKGFHEKCGTALSLSTS